MITRQAINQTTKFECGKLPSFFRDKENCFITEWTVDSNEVMINVKGFIIDLSLIEKCIKRKFKGIKITTTQEYATIHHFFEPSHFYDYINTNVKCKECGNEFMSNDFKSMDNDDDDCLVSTETGCSKCKVYDCCDVEYEKIEDIIKL